MPKTKSEKDQGKEEHRSEEREREFDRGPECPFCAAMGALGRRKSHHPDFFEHLKQAETEVLKAFRSLIDDRLEEGREDKSPPQSDQDQGQLNASGLGLAKIRGAENPASLKLWPVFDRYFGPEDRILDLGCGYGRSCRELYQKGFRDYYGLDLNLSGLKEARKWMSETFPDDPRPSFQAGEAERLPFEKGSFTGLIMQAFLTTIDRAAPRRAVAAEAARVLAPGGRLYLADYGRNTDNPVYLKRYEEGRRMGLEPGAFPARDPETGEVLFIARHYTGEELEKLFKKAGFSIEHHSTQPFVTWTGNRVKGRLLIGVKTG